jgi:hypothetical protein
VRSLEHEPMPGKDGGKWSRARRQVLRAAGFVLAAMAMPSALFTRALAASPEETKFLALSQLLTGRSPLDETIARRLYPALSAESADFAKQIQALATFAQSHGASDVEALVASLDGADEALAQTLHGIIGAWYRGTVGAEGSIKVIAFERALMFDPVRDVVVVPSYCRAAPGYWVAKPPQV